MPLPVQAAQVQRALPANPVKPAQVAVTAGQAACFISAAFLAVTPLLSLAAITIPELSLARPEQAAQPAGAGLAEPAPQPARAAVLPLAHLSVPAA